ncbi:MAG TPA: hypothetical protein ENJ83_04900 [Rhodospirillales bacterium]|nr:hypothetical protein [Rhodospirillales bacterium]
MTESGRGRLAKRLVEWRHERSRIGAYVFLEPVPTIEKRPETDQEGFELARRIAEEFSRRHAYVRALVAVQPVLPAEQKLAHAQTSRERLLGKLQELVDDDEQRVRNPLHRTENGTPIALSPMSKMSVDLLRRLLLAAAGRPPEPKHRDVEVAAMEWPALEELPPEIWIAFDLTTEMFFSAGNFAQAELQSQEIVAGVGVVEGGRKGAARVNAGAPPTEERLAAWRDGLDRARGPDGRLPHGAISEIATRLAERHGTTPSAERRFAYDHAGEIGLRRPRSRSATI